MGGNPRLNKNENLFALFKKTKILFSFKKEIKSFHVFSKIKNQKAKKSYPHESYFIYKKTKDKKKSCTTSKSKIQNDFLFSLRKVQDYPS